jgi:UDP-N-acetylglucosamine--N-acetylmuramyl-(pentapeptide) pyrophosphoryl-undecaprenol N-acetylglucosamine transferase
VSLSVLIAGGGTGGHLYPGIAVARELVARVAGARVTFAGTAAGIESRVVPREGFPLEVIRSAGLKGKSPRALAAGLGLLPLSLLDAASVLSRCRPAVVIGLGGYSSGPVLALAALRRTPTLVMEQNAVPGFTNRRLAPFVSAAAVTYPETERFFGNRAFVSGNPGRAEFFQEDQGARQAADRDRKTHVLIFGGSQGAHAINAAMVEAAPRLGPASPQLAITHQTGERDLDMVRDGYRRSGVPARVEPFLFEMDREMRAADIVICRAGATTLAELTASGRPSILIPLPTATDDHQRRNAEALARHGAATVLEQRELTGERLASDLLGLSQDAPRRSRMEAAARALARPDAARLIVDRVLELASQ